MIPFNAVKYPQLQVENDASDQYGIGMKGPRYHEVQMSLLNKEVKDAKNMLQLYKE